MAQGEQDLIDEDRRVVESESEVAAQGVEPESLSYGIEDIDPRLMQQLVSLDENEVIVPLRMKREDVHKIKGVKLSDEEVVKVSKFQLYLYDRNYLPDNTFASLFCYLFNIGFTIHKQIAEEEARKEEAAR